MARHCRLIWVCAAVFISIAILLAGLQAVGAASSRSPSASAP